MLGNLFRAISALTRPAPQYPRYVSPYSPTRAQSYNYYGSYHSKSGGNKAYNLGVTNERQRERLQKTLENSYFLPDAVKKSIEQSLANGGK